MEQSSLSPRTEIASHFSPLPKHQYKLVQYIAFGVGLLLIMGIFIYSIWAYTQGKKDIQNIVQNQTQQFNNILNSYDNIQNILNETPAIPTIDQADLLDASNNEYIPNIYDDVLGIEEDLGIDQSRKLSEGYKSASKQFDNLKKNNRKIEILAQSNPIVSIMVPQNADLITDTDKFADISIALLSYLQKVNNFEINSTMVGYQIGLAIQEAVLRSADDDSVINLKKKIQEIDRLYDEFKDIDISNIPEDLQKSHTEDLASFDEDVAIFNQILEAFQKKNHVLLEKTLQSIILQGQGASNESKVKFKSFWHENTIINAVDDLSDRWSDYGTRIGL